MLDSAAPPASTAATVDKTALPPPGASLGGVSSTEVLLSEQQVVFSTAAASGVHRENVVRRLVAIARRRFAPSTDGSRARPRYYPGRGEFYEDARMAREMDRL
ncbi:MAG: hypothetical protein QJR12_10405 [Mycobacterium sp.]|uniref:hypothetical protein n=1 Tax=Mycobacterium sp. TaxID=1785 RepID=UPI002613C315|nr:hypothetical protein [Mycobacterium sp.]MDI3314657.1 hypothetical protein [Mycobacterium sp.]